MTKNSDFFFLNLKQMYPALHRPAEIDVEIWCELLEPFSEDDIKNALKDYRKSAKASFVPTPAVFQDFLYPYSKIKHVEDVPFSPEVYLMEQDKANNRLKYFFPTYMRGVDYVLNVLLKKEVGEEMFKTYKTFQDKYLSAVDFGLFADFDKVLDIVYEENY